jgi:hypothetical protein
MSSNHQHRAQVQREGLKRGRAEMFEVIAEAISTGQCNPDIATVALIDMLVERSIRIGIEVEADAIQPEFAEMSIRIAQLENQLKGIPLPA